MVWFVGRAVLANTFDSGVDAALNSWFQTRYPIQPIVALAINISGL